jgi:uncharacterized membrane protein
MTLLVLLLAFALGIVAGLRSMTAPAAVAWASAFGWLKLAGTPLAFLGSAPARYVLAACMVGELIADKLPSTPSRTRPGSLGVRIAAGGLAGAALALGRGEGWLAGAIMGALGAVVGTFGGYRARAGLVHRLGRPDIVVALAEDIIAIGGALLIVSAR